MRLVNRRLLDTALKASQVNEPPVFADCLRISQCQILCCCRTHTKNRFQCCTKHCVARLVVPVDVASACFSPALGLLPKCCNCTIIALFCESSWCSTVRKYPFRLAAEVRFRCGNDASRHSKGGLPRSWLMLGWRDRKNLDERGAETGGHIHAPPDAECSTHK